MLCKRSPARITLDVGRSCKHLPLNRVAFSYDLTRVTVRDYNTRYGQIGEDVLFRIAGTKLDDVGTLEALASVPSYPERLELYEKLSNGARLLVETGA